MTDPRDQAHLPDDLDAGNLPATVKRTNVAIVLDRSGSMSPLQRSVIEAFNGQVDVFREEADKGGDTTMTLVTYGGNYDRRTAREPVEVVLEQQPVEELDKLDQKSYKPGGMTPMLDGVMHAIGLVEPLDSASGNVGNLVVIVSDGRENHSREVSADELQDKIQELQDTGRWTFAFIGANQDMNRVQKLLGIEMDNMATFEATEEGVADMAVRSATASASYMASRGRGVTASSSYGKDYREAQKGETSSS